MIEQGNSPVVEQGGWTAVAIIAAAVVVVAFHLWLVFSGLVPNLVSRPIHMILILPWIFLASSTLAGRLTGGAFLIAGLAACLFIIARRDVLDEQYGALEGWLQYLVAGVLLLTVLELARRAIKLALPIVAAIALAYGFFGDLLPGEFGHAGIPAGSFLGTLTIAEGGIWGPLTGISVNTVSIFVILGAVVSAGEGGHGFMALATRIAGRYRAGAAKVSILASAFFGSISGSASANVASTGAITLPTMKRLGYPPSLAAGVEAVASSGGQIMPPMMGAGAFIMVELLRVQYTDIMAAAILPALLFFWAAWAGIDMIARRIGLQPMKREDLPSRDLLLRTVPFFLLPFGTLLFYLFATGRTPQYAAAIAVFVAAVMLITDRTFRLALGPALSRVANACVNAARQIATIAAVILCAGIIIGVLNQTGLGVKITAAILTLSGGNLWAALLLTAFACLILGMEVPTTAAYVICVAVAGPALQELGLPPLQAHLFVFWYALLSTITPPVCGTVFIAAGMAQTPWIPVAGQAMRLGIGLYLVPLAFVANPALIDPVNQPAEAAWALVKIGAGMWCIALALGWARHVLVGAGLIGIGFAAIFLLP